jgi:hypothetical protein
LFWQAGYVHHFHQRAAIGTIFHFPLIIELTGPLLAQALQKAAQAF